MKKALSTLTLALFTAFLAVAQDKDVNINLNTKQTAWYATPWVWVVGGAVFILLLVALSRGGGRRNG